MKDSSVTKTQYLDYFEKISLSLIFAALSYRLLISFVSEGDIFSLLLLITEGVTLGFVLFRRNAETLSIHPRDWILAYCGSFLPMLVSPEKTQTTSEGLMFFGMLAFAGILLQLWAKLTLRRSFGIVAANRGVKTEGPYRIVRHPMYAGYMMTQIAFMATHYTAYNVTVYAILWSIQIGRLMAEERVLLQDTTYQQMAERVRYRLLPGIF